MRNRILSLIKFAVSAGLLYYLIQKIGVDSILYELGSADVSWMVAGVTLFSISNLIGSLQWYLLLRNTGVRFNYWQIVKYYYIGLFFNNIFISNVGGDFFRLFYITKHADNSSVAVSTVFLDRFLGFTMLTMLAIVGGMYWIGIKGIEKVWFVFVILMVMWLLIILIFFNRKLGALMNFLLKWFVPEKLLNKMKDIYNLVHDISKNKQLVLTVIVLSFFIQIIRVFMHYAAGKAVGVDASFLSFLIFIPLVALFASLPISIGGLGVREQTGVLLFQRVGVPMTLATSMEFLAYLLTILCSLPGVLFFIMIGGWRKRNEKK